MDMSRLDLNLLVILDALFDERRTTRVAERLGMSQAMVSYSLAKLRVAFGDPLFVRSGNAMAPTPLAESLREPIRRVLRTVREEITREATFDPASTRRRFTLCLSDIGELVFLPRLLAALRAQAPGASLRSVSLSPPDIRAGLADGSIDLALGYFPDLQDGATFEQTLFTHRFAVLMRRDHPLQAAPMTLDAFLAADHAVVTQEGRSQEIFEQHIAELSLARRIAFQSPHFLSLPLLLAGSDLVATVPLAVARAFAQMAPVVAIEPPLAIPPIVLKQFWHRRVHADAASRWLRGLVAALFLGRDPSMDEVDPIFGSRSGWNPDLP